MVRILSTSGKLVTALSRFRAEIDWAILFCVLPIVAAGAFTMDSFQNDNLIFQKQVLWTLIALASFFILSFVDFRFFRRTGVIISVYVGVCLALLFLLFGARAIKGARSWFELGGFSFQPVDMAKIALILLLSKYFSRRHVEIGNIKHILVSAFYTGLLTFLVLLQPDFGSAIILISIWLGMVLVSGISKKHLLLVFIAGLVSFGVFWTFIFKEYQKERILNFIHPLADIQGSGYNAYQSTIAVGSGQFLGKGVGYGTQSRLKFLPEYQTDFIFAAFAEEWGFVGVLALFSLYGILFWRILQNAMRGATNFEILFGLGVAIYFMSHFAIHVGMNVGILPVTGTTIPFMSYGGSHLLAEFSALGILVGMRRYNRTVHREAIEKEFVGI